MMILWSELIGEVTRQLVTSLMCVILRAASDSECKILQIAIMHNSSSWHLQIQDNYLQFSSKCQMQAIIHLSEGKANKVQESEISISRM